MNIRNAERYCVDSESDPKIFDLAITIGPAGDQSHSRAIRTKWGAFLESDIKINSNSELRGFDLIGFRPRFMDRPIVFPEFLNYKKVYIEGEDIGTYSKIVYGVVGKHLLLQLREDTSLIRVHPRICVLESDSKFAGFLAVDFLDWVRRG